MPLTNVLRDAAASVQGVQPAPAAQRRAQVTIPSTSETIHISQTDAMLIYYLGKDSAAIPMGVFATGVILLSGLGAFNNNTSKKLQQTFMRARLGSQAVTVCLMMASLAVQERAKALGVQASRY